MSFKCHFCEKTTEPCEKMRLITTRIRNVNYDNGYRGTEIVSEEKCCEKCWLSGTEAHVATTNPEIADNYSQELLTRKMLS